MMTELVNLQDDYVRLRLIREGQGQYVLRLTVFHGLFFWVFPARHPMGYRIVMDASQLDGFLSGLRNGTGSRHGGGNWYHREQISIRPAPKSLRWRDVILHSCLFGIPFPPVLTTLGGDMVEALAEIRPV